MQVQNDTDEDLDIEVQGGRPGTDDATKHREIVKGKGVMRLEGFGPIRAARIYARGKVECLWIQRFDPPLHHDLIVRDAFASKSH